MNNGIREGWEKTGDSELTHETGAVVRRVPSGKFRSAEYLGGSWETISPCGEPCSRHFTVREAVEYANCEIIPFADLRFSTD